MRSRKICNVDYPETFPLYGFGPGPWGSGDRPGDDGLKTNKDDSPLEGPIDVESTVSSDK